MAIDASIYAQYAPRPKSVGDYLADMDAEDSRRQTLQQNKLTLLMNQNKLDDDNRTRAEMGQVRNALLRLSPTATEAQRLEALRGTGTLTGYNQADALAKSLAAQRKAQLDNDKLNFDLAKGRYDIYSRTLGTLAQDPALTKDKAIGAARLLVQQGVLSPEMFEAGTATLSDDPAQLRLQLQQGLAAQATPEQILTLFSAKPTVVDGRVVDFNPRSQGYGKTIVERQANPAQDLVIPGPDGRLMPNQPLIDARQKVAPKTVIDMTGGQKGFDNEMQLRQRMSGEPAAKAFEEMQAAREQVRIAIDQETPISDTAAATKIMKLLDPGSVVRETELAMAMQASGMLDRLTNYVNMKISGKKLTPEQRQDFLQLADGLLDAAAQAYNNKRNEYAEMGNAYGLNADRALGPVKPMVSKPKGDGKPKPPQQQDLQAAAQAEIERRRRSRQLNSDYNSQVLGIGTNRVEGRVTPMGE